MKKHSKSILVYAFMILLAILIAWTLSQMTTPTVEVEDISYGTFIKELQNNNIASVELKRDNETSNAGFVRFKLVTDTEKTPQRLLTIPNASVFDEMITKSIQEGNTIVDYKTIPLAKTGWFINLVVPMIMMAFFLFIVFMLIQQMQGGAGGGNRVMSFGKSKAKLMADDKNKVTFDKVAGLDEEKAELEEIVEFLKQPKKFIEIGARIPKGVLLVGPPGTGKTLIAKAVAGEAGVPFFSISGSDFVEMFVGVGASRVRDLFEQAKKSSPCIIFIDEIDAVGRKRGAGMGGGHDEREQTLNQLLVEMDGFGANEGIIIIAATNRPDILDPALLRPGRFDRQVVVGRPDVKGREEILNVHAIGKLIGEDVDLQSIAKSTAGFTGADLENLLNEAALLSARGNKKEIDMEEVNRAFIKVSVGTEKKSKVISEKDRKNTAYHETGHAIIAQYLSELDPVHMISIIPTGMAGGFTLQMPQEDKSYYSKLRMEQMITCFMGGRVAEELVLDEMTTGPSNDIERATAMAKSMVTKYGMSKVLGPIQFGNDNDEVFLGRDLAHSRDYSDDIAKTIDAEIKNIIETSYNEATRILNEKMDILHKTSEVLIKKEKLTGEEFMTIYNGGDIDLSAFEKKLNK